MAQQAMGRVAAAVAAGAELDASDIKAAVACFLGSKMVEACVARIRWGSNLNI